MIYIGAGILAPVLAECCEMTWADGVYGELTEGCITCNPQPCTQVSSSKALAPSDVISNCGAGSCDLSHLCREPNVANQAGIISAAASNATRKYPNFDACRDAPTRVVIVRSGVTSTAPDLLL